MKHELIIIVCIMAVVLFSGCTPITTVRGDGSEVKHFFGYVRVIYPPKAGTEDQFIVTEIRTLGLRMGKGFGIGYLYERDEFIPLDCRLVVRVADKVQMDEALSILIPIIKEGLCITVSSQ